MPAEAVRSDARGHAALTLVESLIHTLVERSVLSGADALGAVRSAMEVETAHEQDAAPPRTELASELLGAIAASLDIDLPDQVT